MVALGDAVTGIALLMPLADGLWRLKGAVCLGRNWLFMELL